MPLPTDRFLLPDDTPRVSETTINIGGTRVHLYGIAQLTPAQAADTTVLFHIHGRTRSHLDAAAIAHQLLHNVRQRGPAKKGLVVATFDNRNHGIRSLDTMAIKEWKEGNVRHGQDMLSTIDGTIVDTQLVMDFLASYVVGLFVPTQFIMTGLSLGGHVTWDMLARDRRIQAAILIVGSPDLTGLLVERLRQYLPANADVAQSAEWPPVLAQLYAARDARVAAITGKKLLILNGQDDTLVPSKFTGPWVAAHGAANEVAFFEQPGVGHMLSWEGLGRMVDWLPQFLN